MLLQNEDHGSDDDGHDTIDPLHGDQDDDHEGGSKPTYIRIGFAHRPVAH
ncbi:hypothetical protein [Agrobacterium vaccinii]|nr:hypothetical protein [Agrobacterium vaccinii]